MVRGDWRNKSQSILTTHRSRTWGPVEVFRSTKYWEDQFWKTNFVYLYNTYYAKSLLCKHCKEGATVITHFWVPAQNTIIIIIIIIIIAVKRGCQSALKMVKNWLRRFKITKIKI